MRNDWNTAMPPLDEVKRQAEAYNDSGFDVHTINIVLNGQHGGFDVTFQATDADMADFEFGFVLDRNGSLTRSVRA